MTISANVRRFLELQQKSVLEDFRDRMGTCLIATTRERLQRHSTEYNWSIEGIGRISPISALVVTKENLEPELWVRNGYRGYRQAFRRFLNKYYEIEPTSLSADWQVDHLHPSSRFTREHTTYFIRLALVTRRINSSYGAGFERLLYECERQRDLNGGIHMDWMAFLKIRGVPLPSKTAGLTSWQLWAWNFAKSIASEGFDTVFTYVELTTILNLAYTDTWRSFPLHQSFKAEAQSFDSYACIPQLSEA
ncbi:hypothetical protein LH51_08255 [Nitrincola sp. A-D6]|uniref:hypothetical protein n=1 Tax=Nitrincola sp. A-D6 TaxID=1545442 RepID=UPI00051FD6FF|nr:hypothetical protein [Nitrincola sp. A-D6]KGK41393.1 hypothetical protein LH51_15050 [Nitrincola sp. A-D6]KGK42237.1 hypothetical protein LH51_08255 [Nitrincola sp. A-D6]